MTIRGGQFNYGNSVNQINSTEDLQLNELNKNGEMIVTGE